MNIVFAVTAASKATYMDMLLHELYKEEQDRRLDEQEAGGPVRYTVDRATQLREEIERERLRLIQAGETVDMTIHKSNTAHLQKKMLYTYRGN